MVKLAETTNITLNSKYTFDDGAAYYCVPAFGDGNCAFNGFALCLIDLIKRDQLNLQEEQRQRFLDAIQVSLPLLRERVKLYRGEKTELQGNDYSDVADDLERFIEFMQTANYEDLVQYIKQQHNRYAIAALQVGLAPALRFLGANAHVNSFRSIGVDDEELLRDLNNLYRDGLEAGQELLTHLAQDFGVDLHLYSKDRNCRADLSAPVESAMPSVAILHSPGHFDCLLPVKQVLMCKGIAANLSDHHRLDQVVKQRDLLKEKLILSQKDLLDFARVTTETTESCLSEDSTIVDARNLAAISSDVITTVKNKFDVSDAKLEALGIHSDLQKQLLQNPIPVADIDTVSDDEAIARALQNAEILSFYGQNYHSLVRPMSYGMFRGQRITPDSDVLGDMRTLSLNRRSPS